MTAEVDRALWALRAYNTISLATIGEAGPHVAGVYFAPEATERGVRLLIATRAESRLHRELVADPRVAFMCSPGNASRWIQGGGIAEVVSGQSLQSDVSARLVEHAPEARAYIDAPGVVPVLIWVRWLKVVEARDGPHQLLAFDA